MIERESTYYLECSSYSEDNPQGYDDMPIFHRHVWPLIEENLDYIKEIYLFPPYEVKPVIFDKEIINNLYIAQAENIEHRSYYGGHLDVYYRTSAALFIKKLKGLWQRPCILKVLEQDLNVEEFKISFLRAIISELDENTILFGFGHDGDPLYLFGNKKTLAAFIKEPL